MVIYIRGADPALIKAIDKYAERKHLSRSAFLLQAIREHGINTRFFWYGIPVQNASGKVLVRY